MTTVLSTYTAAIAEYKCHLYLIPIANSTFIIEIFPQMTKNVLTIDDTFGKFFVFDTDTHGAKCYSGTMILTITAVFTSIATQKVIHLVKGISYSDIIS